MTLVALALASTGTAWAPRTTTPALYLDGVARDASGALVAIPAGTRATYLPRTRVIDPEAAEVASADRAWLAAGTVPGADTRWADMVEGALLDIRALTLANGAVLAANSPRWRYVWPRDASFAAVALAVANHPEDGLAVLEHLQDQYAASGVFHARYLPDGSGGVPDDRHPQSDGAGWILWASARVLERLPDDARVAAATRLLPLVNAARAFIAVETATPDGLPRPSSDYWEVGETRVTLGTAAPLLAGLTAAEEIYETLGHGASAGATRTAANRLRAAVVTGFGPDAYPRHLGGNLADAATAFALPPFQPTALYGAEEAWRASIAPMSRPAGGVAPGAGWRDDGISWTPQTALYALTAAWQDERELAAHWLTWLSEHRTSSGALPEKVLADGSPAAVAPLSWTCALVVLAVAALDDGVDTRVLG